MRTHLLPGGTAAIAALVILCALALDGCSRDPSGPGVPLVVGQGCVQTSTAQLQGNEWTVDVYETVRTPNVVTGRDGVLVQQTVLSCRVGHCTFGTVGVNPGGLPFPINTEADAISYCSYLMSVG